MATAVTIPTYSQQDPATTYANWLQKTANGAPLAAIRSSSVTSSMIQESGFLLTAADVIAMGTGNGVTLLNTPPVVYSSLVSPILGTSGFSSTGVDNALIPSLIIVHKATWELLWVTGNTAYTGGGAISIVYTGGSVTELSTVPAAGATNSALTSYGFAPLGTSTGILLTAARGVGVSIVNTGGAFATGNSQVYVKLYYSLSS